MTRENCIEAVRGICREHDCLGDKQITALGNLLYGYFETEGDLESKRTADYCEYQGAVDFLWMAFEINLTTKFELLDLLG